MLTRALPAPALRLFADLASAQSGYCANPVTQQDMNRCVEQEWQAADVKLNRAYKAVLAEMRVLDVQLPPELQGADVALCSARRARITFRDENLKRAGFPMRDGSAQPLLVYGSLAWITETRTSELWAKLTTDLSVPHRSGALPDRFGRLTWQRDAWRRDQKPAIKRAP